MRGEYKVLIPFEPKGPGYASRHSPTGKEAHEWKRHWDNLLAICKNLKKASIPYEVEYYLRVPAPYAVILAGDAVKQMELAVAA